MGSFVVSALAYADFIVLVAPSTGALRTMLSICNEFAKDVGIIFKTKNLNF